MFSGVVVVVSLWLQRERKMNVIGLHPMYLLCPGCCREKEDHLYSTQWYLPHCSREE